MRKWSIVAAAVLQAAVLAGMAAQREWVLLTGRTIYLRTAPVDPRDVFRGDYVRLSYEISTVPKRLRRDGLKDKTPKRDTVVYGVLKLDENGRAELLYATDRKPEGELFIRGRADRWRSADALPIRYGLEAYFMEQDRGLAIERGRVRDGIRVPMDMAVALGSNGLAVLKGHRWGKLGLGLDIERDRERRTAKVKVRLLNASDKPLAIVDLPQGRSFSLEPASGPEDDWRWARAGEPRPAVQAGHVRVLQPNGVHEVHINLDDPTWHLVGPDRKPKPITQIGRWTRFRLVYRPPSADECRDLPDAHLIWHGWLPSSAFGRWGFVD